MRKIRLYWDWTKENRKSIFMFFCGVLVCVIVIILIFLLRFIWNINWQNSNFIKWFENEHGSVADWAGAIGTVCAFIIIFWQVRKQASVDRAIAIEDGRPRFSIHYNPKFSSANKVLYASDQSGAKEEIKKNRGNRRFIAIRNISDNVSYSNIFIFSGHTKSNEKITTQVLKYDGFLPNKMIFILPNMFMEHKDDQELVYDSLIIKYTSKKNETGFFEFENKSSKDTDTSLSLSKVYYVKDANKSVTSYGDNEQVISKKSRIFKRLNEHSRIEGSTSWDSPKE